MLTEKGKTRSYLGCLQHNIIAGYEFEAKGKTNKKTNLLHCNDRGMDSVNVPVFA